MKVKCTGYKQNREKYFTIGKIYEVNADGTLTDDTNFKYTALVCGTNPNDWILSHYYEFETITADTYELHITCNDGKTTNAVYKVNGKIEKRTEAVCCPSDTFDFAIGAQTAFDRVFPKPINIQSDTHPCATQPIAPQEDKSRFKVGDKVKVTKPIWGCGCAQDVVGIVTDEPYTNGLVPDWNKGVELVNVLNAKGRIYSVNADGVEPYTEPEKEPEPVYFSGAAIAIINEIDITKGKQYTFENGYMTDNDKTKRPMRRDPIKSVSDDWFKIRFIPYLGEA